MCIDVQIEWSRDSPLYTYTQAASIQGIRFYINTARIVTCITYSLALSSHLICNLGLYRLQASTTILLPPALPTMALVFPEFCTGGKVFSQGVLTLGLLSV